MKTNTAIALSVTAAAFAAALTFAVTRPAGPALPPPAQPGLAAACPDEGQHAKLAANDRERQKAEAEIDKQLAEGRITEARACELRVALINAFAPRAPGQTVPPLELVSYGVHREGGFVQSVMGVIRNNTGEQLAGVQVEFSCYGPGAVRIGDASDMIRNLAPGESWGFKAHAGQQAGLHTREVKFSEITTW